MAFCISSEDESNSAPEEAMEEDAANASISELEAENAEYTCLAQEHVNEHDYAFFARRQLKSAINPIHKDEKLTVQAHELGLKKLVGLETRNIGHPVHHLLELCGGGVLIGLTGALSAGLVIYKYSYVDINHNARRIAIHRVKERMNEYPRQLKQEAVEGFMSLPQDVLKLGPSDFDNMPPVDLIMATPPCMPFSGGWREGLEL